MRLSQCRRERKDWRNKEMCFYKKKSSKEKLNYKNLNKKAKINNKIITTKHQLIKIKIWKREVNYMERLKKIWIIYEQFRDIIKI